MKYDSLSDSTVKITLSAADMTEYDISLYSDSVRSRLSRLLGKMNLFGNVNPERLYLEAFPLNGGGCVLFVSTLGEEFPEYEEKQYTEKTMLMCMVEKAEELSAVCRGLLRIIPEPEAAVYRTEKGYGITVTTEGNVYERVSRFLSEYGRVSRSIQDIYALFEYGVMLCGENACEKLAELF